MPANLNKLFKNKLLPAVTIDDARSGMLLAETYLEAGLDVMEITFRTSSAARAIEHIASELPEMKIGAGTLLSTGQITTARDAGAQFGLSPGFNEKIVQAAADCGLPFIPGVTTPSEIETALNHECSVLKLFPVNHLGGPAYIKSLEGPYRQTGISFIPMGGITQSNMSEYLQLQMIAALGGSWMAPKKLISEGRFREIGQIVRDTLNKSQP